MDELFPSGSELFGRRELGDFSLEDGLRGNVFRSGTYDCTAGGITASVDVVRLIGFGFWKDAKEMDGVPTLRIIERKVMGRSFLIAVPTDARDDCHPYMFGGNFVYTSDSRFPSDNPIKVFDRKE